MNNFKKQFTSFLLAGVLISSPLLFPSSVNDPVTLGNWLTNNFTYQDEAPEEYWKTPKETVRDKGGDCEDFAILAQYVLKKLGYNAYVVVIKYSDTEFMHAICVLKHKDGTFSYYSNKYYFGRRFASVPELLSCHAITWKKAWVVVSKTMRIGLPIWRNKK